MFDGVSRIFEARGRSKEAQPWTCEVKKMTRVRFELTSRSTSVFRYLKLAP